MLSTCLLSNAQTKNYVMWMFYCMCICIWQELPVEEVFCPVVGGNSGKTIVPLISQCIPPVNFDEVSTEVNLANRCITSCIQQHYYYTRFG